MHRAPARDAHGGVGEKMRQLKCITSNELSIVCHYFTIVSPTDFRNYHSKTHKYYEYQ